jgi:uncharacterized membrane protein
VSTIDERTRDVVAGGGVPVGAVLLLGIGFGGFVDGIVLHQILQWHHMLTATDRYPSETIAGLEANTLADGLFHLATWVFVFIGAWWLIRAWQDGRVAPPWRTYVGLLLAGWGAFNLVEGLVDHHVLRVHHVRDDVATPLPWDLGFLAFGALLVVVGWALLRDGRSARGSSRSDRHHPNVRTPHAAGGVGGQHGRRRTTQ